MKTRLRLRGVVTMQSLVFSVSFLPISLTLLLLKPGSFTFRNEFLPERRRIMSAWMVNSRTLCRKGTEI